MRTITKKAIEAFNADRAFKLGNTAVHVGDHYTTLSLHGNDIAQKDRENGNVEITTAGWNTTTTKERLNGIPGVRLHTKAYQLFLNDKPWDGGWTTI